MCRFDLCLFCIINAGGYPRESHDIAICKSEWCKDNSTCIQWSFFFFKRSQTWLTGIYNLYSGLKMKSRGLGIFVIVQAKLGAEKNILLTILWCVMPLLSLIMFFIDWIAISWFLDPYSLLPKIGYASFIILFNLGQLPFSCHSFAVERRASNNL